MRRALLGRKPVELELLERKKTGDKPEIDRIVSRLKVCCCVDRCATKSVAHVFVCSPKWLAGAGTAMRSRIRAHLLRPSWRPFATPKRAFV